ncbi:MULTISPECIES: thiamine pyrophosphate-binding protein [unclassified Nocardioides]|uniref:thiamine pyrophosphate-binding protein n=1 Tax=unclassified Nocardioides TaxID=2615069 RepID=UPI0009EFFECA|nr:MULTISPECIES: thiamine pyrophosphate-binding protein [unclassified Nocardioides]GAW52398.1 IlvG protein [Nocardioides sp. PD653-B2]GAW53932.1 IlvG protein [Nocardioides sp. PD653]
MSERHGGHLAAAALLRQGVDTVFTLCGNHTLALYEGLIDAGIKLVDTRTEAGAVMAADAYARVTRRPGVALVTGGPGHTNGLTGLITAHACSSPVVLLSGQTDLALTGKGAQQEMDQVATAAPLCKWSRMAGSVEELPVLIDEAFDVAMSGSTGAVHLSLPADIVAQPTVAELPAPAARTESAALPHEALARIAELLATAQRPVVIAGSGAYMARAEDALTGLLRASGLPLFTIDLARGMVPDAEPGSLGYADASLSDRAKRIRDADVVLLLGKTLDFRLRFGDAGFVGDDCAVLDIHAPGADVDSNRSRAISVEADIAAAVEVLAADAAGRTWDHAWRAELAAIAPVADVDGLDVAGSETPGLHPLLVARELERVLPDSAGLVMDAGDFVQWCRGVLTARGPGRWLRLGPMSTCGAGTPLALGLKAARPDEPVVLVTGDGSFGYYLIEFETALRQGLPFVAIVGNNNAWGLEYNLQRGLYGDDYVVASELTAVRYDRVIEAMGGYGEYVTSVAELGPAIERAIASGKPACIEVPVSRDPSPLTNAVIARGGQV